MVVMTCNFVERYKYFVEASYVPLQGTETKVNILLVSRAMRMMVVGGYVSEPNDRRSSCLYLTLQWLSRDRLGIISCCMKINDLKAVALVVVVVCGTEEKTLRAMGEQLNVFVIRNEETATVRQMLVLLL